MKGQSINLNWVIGTSIFLAALVFSITYTFNNYSNKESSVGLQEEISDMRDGLNNWAEITIRRTPLIVKGPSLDSEIPVKKKYIFSASAESAVMDKANGINISKNIVRTTANTSKSKHILTQFYDEMDDISYSSDLSGGSILNNSKIEVDPGDPGLEQVRYGNTNLLETDAEFNSSNYTVHVHDIYGETLGGDIEVYRESSEILVDTESPDNYYFRNFTSLYWRETDTTTTLTGNGNFETGSTDGLVLQGLEGSDIGVAFTGDMDANVSKPDNSTVNVSIDSSSRYRVYLYGNTLDEGKDRIKVKESGGIFFGAAEEFEILKLGKLNAIANWPEFRFRDELGVETVGYNLTIYGPDKNYTSGRQIPFQDVTVSRQSRAAIDETGKIYSVEDRIAVWP